MGKRRYKLTELEIPDFEGIPDAVVRRAMRPMAQTVAREARELAPDSGRPHKNKLNKTIGYRIRKGGEEAVVYARAPHAYLVHHGTKSHIIKARKHPWMVFRVKAWVRWAKVVRHPGARANPFLTQALHQCQAEMRRILDEAGREGIEEIV